MIIRTATAADIPPLHRLVERAYRGDSARQGWTHEADLLGGQRTDAEALAAIIADPDQCVLFAEEGDTLVGCVQLKRADSGAAYLGMLAVDPQVQAGGVGRQLMAAAEAAAVDQFGADRIEMTVIKQRSELIAYYIRRGYALTGETRPFPLDDVRFGLPQTDALEFVVLAKGI